MKFELGIDLGGSELRAVKRGTEEVFRTPAFYKVLTAEELILQDTRPNELMDILVRRKGEQDILKRVVIGKSANLYRQNSTALYNDKTKSESMETLVNLAILLAKFTETKNVLTNIAQGGHKRILIDKAIIALPPLEISSGIAIQFKNNLMNTEFRVSFPMLERSLRISFNAVSVLSEGIAAIMSLPEEVADDLYEKYTLVVDSGSRSTDTAIVYQEGIIEGAADTFQISGITFESFIRAELRRTGLELTNSKDTVEIIRTGRFHGRDLIDILNTCKKKYIDSIRTKLIEFCNASQFNINNIDTICLFGRVYVNADHERALKTIDLMQEVFPNKNILIETEPDTNAKGAMKLLDLM